MILERATTILTVIGSISVAWVVSEATTASDYGGTTIIFNTRADDGKGALGTILSAGTTFTFTKENVSTTVSFSAAEVGLSFNGTGATLSLSSSTISSNSNSGEETSSGCEKPTIGSTSESSTEPADTGSNIVIAGGTGTSSTVALSTSNLT